MRGISFIICVVASACFLFHAKIVSAQAQDYVAEFDEVVGKITLTSSLPPLKKGDDRISPHRGPQKGGKSVVVPKKGVKPAVIPQKKSESRTVSNWSSVCVGDEIRLEKGSKAKIIFFKESLRVYELEGPAVVEALQDRPKSISGKDPVLRTSMPLNVAHTIQKLPPVKHGAFVQRGDGFVIISPQAYAKFQSPVFRWTSEFDPKNAKEDTKIELSLFSGKGSEKRLLLHRYLDIASTQDKIDEDFFKKNLEPDREYTLSLIASGNGIGIKSGELTFSFLSVDAQAELDANEDILKSCKEPIGVISLTMLRVRLYEAYGLLDDALFLIQDLRKNFPDNPNLVLAEDEALKKMGLKPEEASIRP